MAVAIWEQGTKGQVGMEVEVALARCRYARSYNRMPRAGF